MLSRKPTRLSDYDYSTGGAYFVTICTHNRRQILSRIVVGADVPDRPSTNLNDAIPDHVFVLNEPRVVLSHYGKIADKYINQLNDFYDDVSVDAYVIMPNHIHLMLNVKENEMLPNGASRTSHDGASRTSPPTTTTTTMMMKTAQHSVVSRFVSTFKRFCNKEYGCNLWQRSFFDHIIRNREDY